MSTEHPTLPALRGLQRLADLRPCVIVDSREQTPLPITRLPVRREGLPSGDYAPAGCELEQAETAVPAASAGESGPGRGGDTPESEERA